MLVLAPRNRSQKALRRGQWFPFSWVLPHAILPAIGGCRKHRPLGVYLSWDVRWPQPGSVTLTPCVCRPGSVEDRHHARDRCAWWAGACLFAIAAALVAIPAVAPTAALYP